MTLVGGISGPRQIFFSSTEKLRIQADFKGYDHSYLVIPRDRL